MSNNIYLSVCLCHGNWMIIDGTSALDSTMCRLFLESRPSVIQLHSVSIVTGLLLRAQTMFTIPAESLRQRVWNIESYWIQKTRMNMPISAKYKVSSCSVFLLYLCWLLMESWGTYCSLSILHWHNVDVILFCILFLLWHCMANWGSSVSASCTIVLAGLAYSCQRQTA